MNIINFKERPLIIVDARYESLSEMEIFVKELILNERYSQSD